MACHVSKFFLGNGFNRRCLMGFSPTLWATKSQVHLRDFILKLSLVRIRLSFVRVRRSTIRQLALRSSENICPNVPEFCNNPRGLRLFTRGRR